MKVALKTVLIAAAVPTLLAGCASNHVHKGTVIDRRLVSAIQPGVDNKDSVEKLLGRPTFTGEFTQNDWYYVSRDTNQIGFRNPRVTKTTVLHVSFDPKGNVGGRQRDRPRTGHEPRPLGSPDTDSRPAEELLRRAVRQHRNGGCRRSRRGQDPALTGELSNGLCQRAVFRLNGRCMTATPAGMTYADYLKLDQLLSAQQPLSNLHDEMLFIVIHQTKELWMKQLLHELRFAVTLVQEDRFAEAYKAMARISRIQAVMTLSWDVLSTLTPVDYLKFRDVLGTSSGFQSEQFREIEFRLGLKDASFVDHYPEGSAERRVLAGGARRAEPSRGIARCA